MKVKKSERKKFANSPNCIAYEYNFDDKEINTSIIELKGRYPDKGRVTNKVCKEIVFVVEGEGKIEIDNKEFPLQEEDMILILPNQKYFFDGKMKIAASCCPAWYSEQHVECD
jgi:mannose-6-phosphate isomerase-like protein (cupin superfamily)